MQIGKVRSISRISNLYQRGPVSCLGFIFQVVPSSKGGGVEQFKRSSRQPHSTREGIVRRKNQFSNSRFLDRCCACRTVGNISGKLRHPCFLVLVRIKGLGPSCGDRHGIIELKGSRTVVNNKYRSKCPRHIERLIRCLTRARISEHIEGVVRGATNIDCPVGSN